MNTKERLKSYIKHKEMRVTAFERSISVSNGYVNAMYKSIGSENRNLIIEKYPDLNMDWLLTGRGEMILPNSNPILDDEKISRNKISLQDKYILLLEQTVALLEEKIKKLTEEYKN